MAPALPESFPLVGERQPGDDDDVEEPRIDVARHDDEGVAVDGGSIHRHTVVGAPGGQLGEIGLAGQRVVEQDVLGARAEIAAMTVRQIDDERRARSSPSAAIVAQIADPRPHGTLLVAGGTTLDHHALLP